MRHIKNIFIIFIGALLMTACNKQILEKQTDPNNPTSVPPSLILGTLLYDVSGLGSQGGLGGVNSWSAVQRWNQYHCSNYDYYDNNIYSWTSGSFDPYLVLKNVVQMEKEAVQRGAASVNPYEAIGRFIRAYYYYNLTSLFGDVPQTEALQAGINPSYTPQVQVFSYVLNELDSANTDLAALIPTNDISWASGQDIFYQGNLAAWQKMVNSFKLRVLIGLSKKASDQTLNVPAQFNNIITNVSKYPIFTSVSDDFLFYYNPGGTNSYSVSYFNPSNYGSIAQRYNMAATYVSALTSLSDPRVFITCEPAPALMGTDVAHPAQYKYFAGASTGEPVQTMYGNANAGLYSFINRYRYFTNYTGDPDALVGYNEMCFNIAEGITRGWSSGNAETWYKAGITSSMAFYGIDVAQSNFTAYFLPPGSNSVTQVAPFPFTFNFNDYYAQASVKLALDQATAINQIVLQKYIACFESSGYEGYYNWRRTGVPAFQGGSGVGNNGIVPLRWEYPVSEQTQNSKNYTAALAAQGFTKDNLNQTMWLLK